MPQKRLARQMSKTIRCRDNHDADCQAAFSVRDSYISISVRGGDEWAHITTKQADSLASWLTQAAEEIRQRADAKINKMLDRIFGGTHVSNRPASGVRVFKTLYPVEIWEQVAKKLCEMTLVDLINLRVPGIGVGIFGELMRELPRWKSRRSITPDDIKDIRHLGDSRFRELVRHLTGYSEVTSEGE